MVTKKIVEGFYKSHVGLLLSEDDKQHFTKGYITEISDDGLILQRENGDKEFVSFGLILKIRALLNQPLLKRLLNICCSQILALNGSILKNFGGYFYGFKLW